MTEATQDACRVSGGVQGGNTDSSIRQLVGNIPAAVAVTKKTPTDPRFIIETLQVGRAALPCIGLCGFVTLHVTLHVTAFFKNGVLLAFRFRLNGGMAGKKKPQRVRLVWGVWVVA